MKTNPMAHQKAALAAAKDARGMPRDYFAYLMEQGTGKTWVTMAEAEQLYGAGAIDAVLIIAPRGVHTNWVRREIPAHMDCLYIARAWRSGMGIRERKRIDDLLKPREEGEQPPLRIFSINIDALAQKDAYEFTKRFLIATKALTVVDESSRIKTPTSGRTKNVISLRHLSKYRRILSGTPITNAPTDIFSQFEFLDEGLLGTTSYRAFVAEFSVLADPKGIDDADWAFKRMIEKNPKLARAQIVKKDEETGRPMYRNLDKLSRMISRHSYRVLKRDCLDLPEKIYTNHYFDLTPKQRKTYDALEQELAVIIDDEEVAQVDRLAALTKLQQITSGYVLIDGEPVYVVEDNPRLNALMEFVENIDGPFIVWARFKEEVRAIAAKLREVGCVIVEYHGGVKDADRERAVDDFQSGRADGFVGNPQAGGIGLTLTKAEYAIYYSNDFNLETRLQSEDRNHRIGTTKSVVYCDIIALDTRDEKIVAALQAKEDVADHILNRGDRARR